MSNEKIDKIKSKIEKLLRLQASAEKIGSLDEAALAAAKASKLMMEYNIEVSMGDALDESEVVNWIEITLNDLHGWNKTEAGWMRMLYHTISKHNFCKVIYAPYKMGGRPIERLKLFGEDSNMEMVQYICDQMIYRLKEMHKVAWATYHGPEKKNTYKRGYLAGAVQGIHTKLVEQEQANKMEYSTLTDLIIVKDAAVQDKIDEVIGRTTRGRSKRLSGQDGRARGFHDGKNMSVNKGIKSGQKRLS